MPKVAPWNRPGAHKKSSQSKAKRRRTSSHQSQRSSGSASRRSPSPLPNNMSDDEYNDVHAQLAAAKRKLEEVSSAKTTGEDAPKVDPSTAVIKKALKMHVWREAKFISTNAQLTCVSKLVLKHVAPKNMKAAEIDPWIEDHKKTVSRELNSHRSYVVQRIKDICWE